MNKKCVIVFIIIISIIINLYTGFLVFLDYLAEYRTIEISNQSSYISKEIKEHFDIDYDIKKVKFYPGFPDGYYLDIYDLQNECHHEFEDKHEKSEIYDYFKNIKYYNAVRERQTEPGFGRIIQNILYFCDTLICAYL